MSVYIYGSNHPCTDSTVASLLVQVRVHNPENKENRKVKSIYASDEWIRHIFWVRDEKAKRIMVISNVHSCKISADL